MPDPSRLAALIDGVKLPDEEARALWTKFSEHMEANRGDVAGFAKLCGYAKVAPEAREGQAVLVVYTTEAAMKAAPAPGAAKQARPPGGQGGGGGRKGNGGKPQRKRR